VIDLTPGSREVLLYHADAVSTVLYYREAVVVAQYVRMIPITHVFQNNIILRVQWDIATVLALMKQILGNQNDTDIPMMAAFRK
jgi:hypothetical protein